jgi:DNA-binding CsgD family transcriptional regulator
MRASPALVQIETSCEAEDTRVAEAIRALVGLIEKIGPLEGPAESPSEDVLIDTEVNGSRYLLVRMPQSAGSRIQLSPREQEIVRMVAKGHPNKVIADVLNISSWTVCTHLRRIFAKLGVGSRAAMVARLLEVGMLTNGHSR